jgi:phosphatidate cytidylyltransferase
LPISLGPISIPFSREIFKVALTVSFIIGLCSVTSFLHPRLRRPEARGVRQAINSWWPPALLSMAAVLLGPVAAFPIFLGVSTAALAEYLRFLPEGDRAAGAAPLAFAAVPLHYAALAAGHAALADSGVILFGVFLVLPLVRALRHGPEGLLGGAARVGLGVVIAVFAIGHVARLFLLPARVGPAGAEGLAGLLLLCVMANDASQYVAGKLAGRHLLSRSLSPKKTWEGLAGGVLATTLVAALAAPVMTPFGRAGGALVGAALSVLGVLGDLLMSAIKRDVGVKDSGTVLPGQGGVLDRTDSLILSAPLYYHAVTLWLL